MNNYHLYIIVPFRARGKNEFRQNQLEFFIPYMEEYLTKQAIKYSIFVMEQNDDQPFNRGKLFNIGMLEAKKETKENKHVYFCHQNVDIIPTKVNYKILPKGKIIDIQGWDGGLGAMYFCDMDSYELINGYPNDLWGYGADDSAILERCKLNNIPVDRSHYNNGDTYELNMELRHLIDPNFNQLNRDKYKKEIESKKWKENGLNSCLYTIASVKKINHYTHFLVNL